MAGSSFENYNTNYNTDPADLSGLGNLELIFEGVATVLAPFEIRGRDLGAVLEGFDVNFALGTLTLGGADIRQVQLVDTFDNQPGWSGSEALYVSNLIMNAGATVDLNDLHLYYLNGGAPKQFFNGDADLDGDVDAANYIAWHAGFGTTTGGIWETGDFDGDGDVDAADYIIWQASFGSVTSEGAPVPEPATLMLLLAGGVLAIMRNRRK